MAKRSPDARRSHINVNITDERDQALSVLDLSLRELSIMYKECYLSVGKGALMLYASDIINNKIPSEADYRSKKEILFIFDDAKSKASLSELVDSYDPRAEGVLVLITSYSNASFFVTVKLK